MANKKSAEKRNRQNIKHRAHNRDAKVALRLAIKKARAAITAKDASAKELISAAERTLAKAANKGLIHKKNAARRISRLRASVAPAK